MIGDLLHWFYCLPLGWVVALPLILTAVFLVIRSKFQKYILWHVVVAAALVGWLAICLYVTVGNRESGGGYHNNYLPFHSYRELFAGGDIEILRSNLMNLVLFFPGGLLLISAVPEKQRKIGNVLIILGVFLAFSAAIEAVQYFFAMGRFQTDDLIHNFLGSALGVLLGLIRLKLKFKLSFK